MIYFFKINFIYLSIILISIMFGLNKYIWKPIISSNIYIIYIFNILKFINSKIFIICLLIMNIIILYLLFRKYKINNINIIIFILLKLIIGNFIKFLLKKKIKILRPCILYINKELNIDINKFSIFIKSNENYLFNKLFNKILNIDYKYNLINNYYSVISGHTLFFINLYDIYFLIFYKLNKYNLLLIFLLIINIFIIYSRLILGMHFLMDIILSIILNFILCIFMYLIYLKI